MVGGAIKRRSRGCCCWVQVQGQGTPDGSKLGQGGAKTCNQAKVTQRGRREHPPWSRQQWQPLWPLRQGLQTPPAPLLQGLALRQLPRQPAPACQCLDAILPRQQQQRQRLAAAGKRHLQVPPARRPQRPQIRARQARLPPALHPRPSAPSHLLLPPRASTQAGPLLPLALLLLLQGCCQPPGLPAAASPGIAAGRSAPPRLLPALWRLPLPAAAASRPEGKPSGVPGVTAGQLAGRGTRHMHGLRDAAGTLASTSAS